MRFKSENLQTKAEVIAKIAELDREIGHRKQGHVDLEHLGLEVWRLREKLRTIVALESLKGE